MHPVGRDGALIGRDRGIGIAQQKAAYAAILQFDPQAPRQRQSYVLLCQVLAQCGAAFLAPVAGVEQNHIVSPRHIHAQRAALCSSRRDCSARLVPYRSLARICCRSSGRSWCGSRRRLGWSRRYRCWDCGRGTFRAGRGGNADDSASICETG